MVDGAFACCEHTGSGLTTFLVLLTHPYTHTHTLSLSRPLSRPLFAGTFQAASTRCDDVLMSMSPLTENPRCVQRSHCLSPATPHLLHCNTLLLLLMQSRNNAHIGLPHAASASCVVASLSQAIEKSRRTQHPRQPRTLAYVGPNWTTGERVCVCLRVSACVCVHDRVSACIYVEGRGLNKHARTHT